MTRAATRTNTPKTDPHTTALFKRLDDLAKREPDLAGPIAFYRQALPALHDAQAHVEPFALDPETAARKLRSAQPLLVGESLPLDMDATRDLFLQLCQVAEKTTLEAGQPTRSIWTLFKQGKPDSLPLMERAQTEDGATVRAAAARRIRQAVAQNQLDLGGVLAALAMGDRRRLELMAAGLQLDSDLLSLLAQNSLRPALRVWARGLRASDFDDWRRGQCPVCGNPPLIAEIQGKEGERRLRCGACGVSWHYPRLKCVFCGNSDHKSLGYIGIEGEEEKYRVQTCDICHGYIKVVVTFDPTPADQLLVEDLATLHLDFVASERGYLRAAVQ